MKRSNRNFFLWFVTLLGISLLFQNCTQEPVDPDKNKKKGEMIIEVSQEGDVIINNDCSRLQGFLYDMDEGLGYKHALTIRGITDDGKKGAVLIVYFNEEQDLQSGTISADIGDDYGVTPYFSGQVMTDISGSTFTAFNSNIFDDEGESKNQGSITFTKYDQTNGIISGRFFFKGIEFKGVQMGTKIVEVSGTFENVIVFPTLNEANQCYGGPSLPGGGSGGNPNPNPGPGPNPNPNPNPGSGMTTLNFKNTTFTTITLEVSGQSYLIDPGQTVGVNGKAGTTANYSGKTSGKTSSGTLVGNELIWNGSNTFPSSGSLTIPLSVSGTFFFLRVVNNSSMQMTKIYVNYGLQSQTVDNVTIPNDGLTYGLGYYKAYSNSNVRAENGNTYWMWNSLNLTSAANQAITVYGN